MKLADIGLPNIELSSNQRDTLEKYLPLMFVALLVWFAAKGLRRMFWIAFAMFWAFGGVGGLRHLFH